MSPDATPPQPPPPPPVEWPPLPITERRVLGVLIEKQKTSKSSDAYPLTLNALTLGCNQKSNRDPVLDLSEDDVEETLSTLQKKGLVMRITGGRVDRFRHLLYDTWTNNGPQLAVLAELLLRGPQTKGELRGRAARMDPIDTLDALEEVIKPLVERRLVVYLNAPDRRGTVLSHGFHLPDELARLKTHHASAPSSAAEPDAGPVRAPAAAALEARLAEALADIAALKAAVAGLESQVAELKTRIGPLPANP
ncbi:MAG TPA: DUF480 domain-containing protein [Gemmataceae bacterium]|nr:DUF480 domain-containing protein [Gemmataceae bacterium]